MRYYFLRFTFLNLLLICTACNNFDFEGIRKRYRESTSGSLSSPNNIDPGGTNNFSFAVMGDTHLGVTAATNIQTTMETAKNAGDSFVVVAGDISNLGKEDEMNSFVGTLNAISFPFRVAIGNHDLYFNGWENFKKFFGRSIYSFDADNVHIVMLDSGNGVLGEPQLNWLKSDLAATTQPHKIVVSHYPPISGGFDNVFKMSSEEEAAILKDILHKNNVSYMFSGHYHGYRELKLGNTTYVITGAVNTVLDPGNDKHFIRVKVNGNAISHQKIDL